MRKQYTVQFKAQVVQEILALWDFAGYPLYVGVWYTQRKTWRACHVEYFGSQIAQFDYRALGSA
jgi:hypothetical protein